MENLVEDCFGGAFSGKKVLITGHNGFKGSWLTCWLQKMGAQVYGISKEQDTEPSHWQLLKLAISQWCVDVSDFELMKQIVNEIEPEIVFHLAAQPLVRQSYRDPLHTWHSNVMGTVNLLEACKQQPSVKAIVVVTTDKVYQNSENGLAFKEDNPLGGFDPYSASKAACELVIQSYRNSFFDYDSAPLLASARAGNVLGGGDWAADRLVPDIVRACHCQSLLKIRNPMAVRPWQHVLDSLSAYLTLGAALLSRQKSAATGWNFGPDENDCKTTLEILGLLKQHWPDLHWENESNATFHEAKTLSLNTDKAKRELNWEPVWNVYSTAAATASWYQAFYQSNEIKTSQQIQDYIYSAKSKGLKWAS